MKQLASLIFSLLVYQLSIGQVNEIKEITPDILLTIKENVNKQSIKFRATLASSRMTTEQIEFSVDTFKIERIGAKRIDIDYSTQGMNRTANEMTASYDLLLNKYYKKLLSLLKKEDKKVLIAAQRAWVNYRVSEAKLIWVISKDEYSEGETAQSNITTGSYSYLVQQRVITFSIITKV